MFWSNHLNNFLIFFAKIIYIKIKKDDISVERGLNPLGILNKIVNSLNMKIYTRFWQT